MGKYDTPEYQDVWNWVIRKSEKGSSWEALNLANKTSDDDLSLFLESRVDDDDWPILTVDEWKELVLEVKAFKDTQVDFKFRGNDGALFSSKQDNGLDIPTNPQSAWQQYKNGLGWDDTTDLEDATLGILRRLNNDTKGQLPVKGLVIGHVQSGKTANMEALMAMAADHGWNFFIILSGTIENLRLQTLRRIYNDLSTNEGNLNWVKLEHPSKNASIGERAIDCKFNKTSKNRYFTVCLKNATRLRKLIDWIHDQASQHDNMRILIIDDEADQASISNTVGKEERKGINNLIVKLVKDEHYLEGKSNGKARAINYVMYTATPYANFLNECDTDEDMSTLYPSDFIWTLKTSNNYIGPNQIFGSGSLAEEGNDYELDIKREVPEEDLDVIANIYSGETCFVPNSLKDAVCWFICCVAAMRYLEYKKPISMLIHTSQKQVCHDAVANVLSKWLKESNVDDLVMCCRKMYLKETTALTKEDWLEQVPKYGTPKEDISDYPSFEEIEPLIRTLLDRDMAHIKLSEEGDFEYTENLHLVIDNCSKKFINSENEHIRLAYPDPNMKPYPAPAPAFIVIGGSTLSRGLTLEGLVCTYFLRSSCQADTLMQMGRWFGYRKGYELFPRIWMTEDTISKFRFLAELEVDLRNDLKKYMVTDVVPRDYGPRILSSPKTSWLRLTSRKHMVNAVPAEYNFGGSKPQTTVFDADKSIQQNNIDVTEAFLNSLKQKPTVSANENSIVWKDVDMDTIVNGLFVNAFKFCKRSRVFNDIEPFCDWIKTAVNSQDLNSWSVIVAGSGPVEKGNRDSNEYWNIGEYSIRKVNRSRKPIAYDDAERFYDIGVLRSLRDCVADIDKEYINGMEITTQKDVDDIRRNAGMEEKPILVIYRINKDSKPSEKRGKNRMPLDAPCDLIGLHVCIPGEKYSNSFTYKLTINIPNKTKEESLDEGVEDE